MASSLDSKRAVVLLVEDDAIMGEAIKELIECLGYGVQWHRNAEDVYDEFRATPARPDLILLDLTLGRVDGVTLIRQLRNEFAKLPPVVLCSAVPEADLAQAARDTDAAAAVSKPAGLLNLGPVLASALNGPHG